VADMTKTKVSPTSSGDTIKSRSFCFKWIFYHSISTPITNIILMMFIEFMKHKNLLYL
jgi:hypothetical protein